MKILVAEDDTDSRVYLARILQNNHYDVEVASNGLAAWNLAQQSPPDLIVSDILMPEMDGFALCLQWKQDEKLKRIPFVFYTATYTEQKDKELALSLGAQRFLTKPQSPDVLLQIIGEVLAESVGEVHATADAAPSRSLVIEQYNAALFRKLEKKVQQLEQEIEKRKMIEAELFQDVEAARQVQLALVPPLISCKHVEVSAIYQPHGHVGGDLYFLDWRHNGSLLRGFLIEAMGQGLGMALYAAAQHVMLRELNEAELPLSEQVRALIRRVTQHFSAGKAANCIAFEVDLATHELRWVSAGLTKFWAATTSATGMVERTASDLLADQRQLLETHRMPLAVGNCFYFCTGEFLEILTTGKELPLADYPQMVELLATTARAGELHADVTALCIQIKSLPNVLFGREGWPRMLHLHSYGDYQRFKGEVAKTLAAVTGKKHSLQEVAVNEALANAMECRDGVARPHRSRLRVNKIGAWLVVRVKTSRMGFAGNAILRRLRSQPGEMFSFGEVEPMGRGIPMMLSMTDKMTYNSEGTEVLLAWKM